MTATMRAARQPVAAVLVALATGCVQAPLSPSGAPFAPEHFDDALAALDAYDGALAIVDEQPGRYVRSRITRVVFGPCPSDDVALACITREGVVYWSSPASLVGHDVRYVAGVLVHEARHRDGYPHDCPGGRTDSGLRPGAYAAQVAWLEASGAQEQYVVAARARIGCSAPEGR